MKIQRRNLQEGVPNREGKVKKESIQNTLIGRNFLSKKTLDGAKFIGDFVNTLIRWASVEVIPKGVVHILLG